MSPTDSRRRKAVAGHWEAYDRAGRLALEVRSKATVIGHPVAAEQKWLAAPPDENEDLIGLLDLLRSLLRERIEAEAAAGFR